MVADFLPVIQQILTDDELAPNRQHHTARRIIERLRDECAYQSGYSYQGLVGQAPDFESEDAFSQVPAALLFTWMRRWRDFASSVFAAEE